MKKLNFIIALCVLLSTFACKKETVYSDPDLKIHLDGINLSNMQNGDFSGSWKVLPDTCIQDGVLLTDERFNERILNTNEIWDDDGPFNPKKQYTVSNGMIYIESDTLLIHIYYPNYFMISTIPDSLGNYCKYTYRRL